MVEILGIQVLDLNSATGMISFLGPQAQSMQSNNIEDCVRLTKVHSILYQKINLRIIERIF